MPFNKGSVAVAVACVN